MKKEYLWILLILLYFLVIKEPEIEYVPCSRVDDTIIVEIKGEVLYPGIYELEAGARVYELIDQAGGITDDAALLNQPLSNVLSDGDVIRIEHEFEVFDDARINLNTAPAILIESLPGLGSTKANAIVSYREEHGLFTDCTEVLHVDGIGESTLQVIQDFITCG